MNKRTVKNLNLKNNVDDMILAEMIFKEKDIKKVFSKKEIVNEDIDAFIFGEIDADWFYHSEK